MALVRWRLTSALRAYCRLDPRDYAAFIDAAAQQDAASLQGPNLPPLQAQHLPPAQLSVPGALPPELYRLLDRALGHGQSEPGQTAIRALASQIPEIDADLWVHEFSSLDLHRDPGEQEEVASDEE